MLRNTISGGRWQGVMTGLGHGIGLGIYAFIAVIGLSSVLLADKQILYLLQVSGALLLVYMAFNLIFYKQPDAFVKYEESGSRGFLEGFMIAFLNPKILVFFVAVFSQFINIDINNFDRFVMAIMAGAIDAMWYVFVATVLASTSFIHKLRENAVIIDRFIGMVLFMLASLLIVKILGINMY